VSSADQAKISPKQLGDGVAGDVIQRFEEIEHVSDTEATWHDARTTAALFPDDPDELLFGGICAVEPDTPIEIKATLVVRSSGKGSQRNGAWYIKRKAHDQLLEAGGVYLLVVYVQRRGREHLARIVVPAATIDDFLQDKWYEVRADRSENEVAQLVWTEVIDESRLNGGGGMKRTTGVRHRSTPCGSFMSRRLDSNEYQARTHAPLTKWTAGRRRASGRTPKSWSTCSSCRSIISVPQGDPSPSGGIAGRVDRELSL